jgi:hypothetical protein
MPAQQVWQNTKIIRALVVCGKNRLDFGRDEVSFARSKAYLELALEASEGFEVLERVRTRLLS